MKKMLFVICAICLAVTASHCAETGEGAKKMKITSPEFKNNEYMPERFGYTKDNVNPELAIDGVPPEAKSLVLIVDDPDAPRGTWVHWVMYDIPIIDRIEEDSVPGIQGVTDYREKRYGGPMPPSGARDGQPDGFSNGSNRPRGENPRFGRRQRCGELESRQ